MGAPPPESPDLVGVITAANQAELPYVIIGGFAVIANQYVRATEDVDLLISDDRALDRRRHAIPRQAAGTSPRRARSPRACYAGLTRCASTVRMARWIYSARASHRST